MKIIALGYFMELASGPPWRMEGSSKELRSHELTFANDRSPYRSVRAYPVGFGLRRIEIDFRGAGDLRNAPRSNWETVVKLSATQTLHCKWSCFARISFGCFYLAGCSCTDVLEQACGKASTMAYRLGCKSFLRLYRFTLLGRGMILLRTSNNAQFQVVGRHMRHWYKQITCHHQGFRTRHYATHTVKPARPRILNCKETADFTSFLLSESSLFVSKFAKGIYLRSFSACNWSTEYRHRQSSNWPLCGNILRKGDNKKVHTAETDTSFAAS